jgi:two-component system, response regulator PdtaR
MAVVDIRLTGPIDGIELACRLRQKFGVPSIFLSGLVDAETMRRAAAAQPLGFLAKPFVPSQVFKAIDRAVSLISG